MAGKIPGDLFARKAYEMAVASTGEKDSQSPRYVYPGKGSGEKTMDCQGFVEEVLRACGLKKNWRGSNAMWRDMAWRGTPEECRKAFGRIPAGAWLYIVSADMAGAAERYQKDGLGNAEHVGIYTGLGKGAAHSSSSRGGVCQSVFRGRTVPNGGWNMIGLPGFMDFGTESGEGREEAEKEEAGVSTGWARVNAMQVRLRTGPGTAYPWHCRLNEGDKVEILEPGSAWSKVDWNGRKGYVMSNFLEKAEPERQAADRQENSEQEATAMREMQIYSDNGGKVKLRAAPSTSCNWLARLDAGTPVEAGEDMNGWTKVRWGSQTGYVMSEYLRDAEETESREEKGEGEGTREKLVQVLNQCGERIREALELLEKI